MTGAIRAFRVDVPQAEIDDLRLRLAETRWPREEPVDAGWTYGANMAYVRELCTYWADGFDWRALETRINARENLIVTVEGQDIHVMRVKAKGGKGTPLLLTHGWPGSFLEFIDVVDRLSERFEVIVPSLPGYGFSAAPKKPIDCREVARLWRHMMVDHLGYPSFIAQGGDWGCLVTSWLGLAHGDVCKAIHQNMWIMRPNRAEGDPPYDAEEIAWLERRKELTRFETAYQAIQSTKFQTLAYGLTDSPTGLAAWITEKFHGWGDTRGDVESRFSKDRLLANIALYWFTGSINSSTWMYRSIVESDNFQPPKGQRITVPVGVAHFPGDVFATPPRQWVERFANVVHWTTMPAGGHFAAMEEPDAFVEDVGVFADLIGA
ncbi:MAG: epoxide hydrolase [Pseudomonadota bacterium]|nr:epoxide hydrolase [Pseudomonadota bacterium]